MIEFQCVLKRYARVLVLGLCAVGWPVACAVGQTGGKAKGLNPREVADLFHAIVSANRAVYSQVVVNRLMLQDKVMKASEHYLKEKALPLPAQLFRLGAELATEKNRRVFYSLHSYWPLNKQNAPRTKKEKDGLAFVTVKGENFYGEEVVDGIRYFIAVYPDRATDPSCVNCHNNHKDSPRRDFKIDEVMGGVVIRLPFGE
ncbi:MAG: Tll0287-like domain-containing protein [Hyphomicrobiaceae bacterium]